MKLIYPEGTQDSIPRLVLLPDTEKVISFVDVESAKP